MNGLPATSSLSKENSASAGRLIERMMPSLVISTTPSVAVSMIVRISATRARSSCSSAERRGTGSAGVSSSPVRRTTSISALPPFQGTERSSASIGNSSPSRVESLSERSASSCWSSP
jgi:hypothetical protein